MGQFFVVTIAAGNRTLFYDVFVDETADQTFDRDNVFRPTTEIAASDINRQGGFQGEWYAVETKEDPGQLLETAMTNAGYPGIFVWPRTDDRDISSAST